MESSHRRLLLIASVPLVLLLAGPAPAATEFSMYKCENPESAASDTYDYFSDNPLNTSDFGTEGCEKLCSELLKICKSNVKNRIACVNTDDSFFFKLQKKLCDVYYTGDLAKECKDVLKGEQNFNKEQNKSLQEEADFECEDDFGPGGPCQFDCEDGILDDD